MRLFLVLGPSTASDHIVLAQEQWGSIDATVLDESGAAIAGAGVFANNESNAAPGKCKTSTEGFCRVENLPAGKYRVRVEATGFKAFVMTGLEVGVGPEKQVRVTLNVGATTEAVEVIASTATVETQTDTVLSSSVPESEIAKLTIMGRNFQYLLTLQPGTTTGPTSASGARPDSNTYIIVGVDASDSYRNIQRVSESGFALQPSTSVPLDAVREVAVSTQFDSSQGTRAGAATNVALKSGTNQLHGAIYDYFRNNELDARNFFDSVDKENALRYNNFGLSIGGPFSKEKAFWFISYEGQRSAAQVTTLSSVPSPRDFTQAVVNLGGNPAVPLAQNPVVNPIIRNLLALCLSFSKCPGGANLWPSPTSSRASRVLNSIAKAPDSFDSDSFVFKGDFDFNRQNRLSGYASVFRDDSSFPLALTGGDYLPQTNTLNPLRTESASLSYAGQLGNKPVDMGFAWTRSQTKALDEDAIGIRNPAQTIGLDTGVTNVRDFGLPHFVVRNFASLGSSPFSNPRGHTSQRWRAGGNLRWTVGRHNIKTGYLFLHDSVESFNDPNFKGTLEFGSLQDFLAGTVARGSIQRGNSDRTTIQNMHAAYLQEEYRRTSSLILTFGVRWEYFGVLHEKDSLFSTYTPAVGLFTPRRLYEPDLNNFGPRVGLVWDIHGKRTTVVRMGAGFYFDSAPQDFFVGRIQFNTFNAGVAYNAIPTMPILVSRSASTNLVPSNPVFSPTSFATDTRDVSTVAAIRTPYVLKHNLTLERELFKKVVLKTGYVGSVGRKLFRLRDVNFPALLGGPRPFDTAAVLSRLVPNHPFVVNQLESSATSSFNALEIGFEQQRWHDLNNSVTWRWSHSIDNASDGYDLVPNQASPDNPRFPARERASSNFDMRHLVTWFVGYEFPPVVSLGRFGRGWGISGNLRIASGQPFHVNFANEFDSQGTYDFILRPDVVANPLMGTRAPDRILNLAAFQVPCTLDGVGTDISHCVPGTLHFGNLPRNAFRGPNFGRFDLAISKTTPLKDEKLTLLFRAEVFNLTNHPNFTSPLLPNFIARASQKGITLNGRGGAAGVGCSTSAASDDCYLGITATSDVGAGNPFRAGGARAIQLSLKIIF